MSKLLLYCTKSKKQLFFDIIRRMFMFGLNGKNDKFNSLNGKIVAECDFEVEEIEYIAQVNFKCFGIDEWFVLKDHKETNLYKHSCLGFGQMLDYFKDKLDYDTVGYAIHIKNLQIFDKPINIRNYYNIAPRTMQDCMNQRVLVKAPQNMMYAYDNEVNKYVLISIQPQLLCKILNGEKTIEIRKKVLKEML